MKERVGGGKLQAVVVGDRQTDRAVMRLKVREIRRKHGSMGCHSVRSANHRAPHGDGSNRPSIDALKLVALTQVMKLKV